MIKKRNLDNALIQWIMNVTGLGPGIGEIRYLAPAASSTSQYRTQLQKNDTDDADMFTTLTAAENALVAYRNDIVLALPGAYDEALEINWDKANSHILGLSGRNTLGDYYEPGVVIYTDTSAAEFVLDVTAPNAQFHNIAIQNAGNSATNYAAVRVNIYATYWKNCSFMGQMAATTAATAVCGALYIHTNGHTPIFEDCMIGQDVWSIRSGANGGVIRFSGSQPNDGQFIRCTIKSISNTGTCALVAVATGTGIGRGWEFKNCIFSNFSSTPTQMNQVFYGPSTAAWWPIYLHHCSAYGFDRWTDETSYRVFGTMPIADDGGGLEISLDQTVAGGG